MPAANHHDVEQRLASTGGFQVPALTGADHCYVDLWLATTGGFEGLALATAIMPLACGRFHMLVQPWVRQLFTSPLKWWSWKDIVLEPH